MNQPIHLTLVRHGETLWNREFRLQGSQDIPLSDTGLAQATAIAKRLSREQFQALYSSHLQRAHKTAETIAEASGVLHRVHKDLHERHFGEIEGHTRDEILKRYPAIWGREKTYDVAGVEPFDALRERSRQAIEQIADQHPGEHVVIVSHGGTINAFLHSISDGRCGTGISTLGNTSVTRVLRDQDGVWQIIEIGCTAHLDG